MKNTENMNYLVLGCIFEPYTCQVFSDGFVPNTKKALRLGETGTSADISATCISVFVTFWVFAK